MANDHSPKPGRSQGFDYEDYSLGEGADDAVRRLKARRLMFDLLGRWHWIALGLVLGVLAAAYYLSKAPVIYTATATLLVKQQTTSLMQRDQIDDIDLRTLEGLNTIAARIGRADLLNRVAARVDVRSLEGLVPPETEWRPAWLVRWFASDDDPADEDAGEPGSVPQARQLAPIIGSWMKISIREGTRLIDVSINHPIPEVAEAVANAIVQEYIAEIADSVAEGRTTASTTLLMQSEEVRAKLQEAESALAAYTRALELNQALEERENNVAQLARRYLPKHPAMAAAISELASLKARFLDEFDFARRAASDQAYWDTAASQLEAVKDDPEDRLRLARQLILARAGVLRGEINSQMQVFNAMLTRVEETNVNLLGDQASAEINNLAEAPRLPSSPKRARIYAGSGVGGLGLGLAFAFLLVRLDSKFNTVSQTEDETSMPVLAAISDLNENHLREAERTNAAHHPDAPPPDPARELWEPHLVFRDGISHTNYAEMFRVLRASITLLGDETTRKVTLFSSALPGEGKSLVSSNFALASAGQGKKTLLIDLDLRKPRVHRVFGILGAKNRPGITDWLAGRASLEDCIHTDTGAENLHIMLSGTRAPNPGELLKTEGIRRLFDEATANYDAVVVDSAPLLAVPDTRVVAPLADNFCLVVRAHYVARNAVLRALELLKSANTPPAGIVLNGFKETRRLIGQNHTYGQYRHSRFGRPYQYGYGTYGAYGSDDDNAESDDREILKRRSKTAKSRPAKNTPGKSRRAKD